MTDTTQFEITDEALRAFWRDLRDPYRIAAARIASGGQAAYPARDVLNLPREQA